MFRASRARILLAALLPLLLCAAASPAAETGRCRQLTVSANPDYPPYHWAEGQALAGASLDLLRQALPPGVAVRLVVYPWKRVLEGARNGEIDLILSLRETPERREYLTFTSTEAFPNPIVVFVRADRVFPLRDWSDLKGRAGGVSTGDTFGCGFDEYWRQELSMDEAADMDKNFQKLIGGRIDYFVTGKYVGLAYAATHPYAATLAALEPPLCGQGVRFGFSKASPCAGLVGEVDRRLRELARKGVPEKLLLRHLERLRAASAQYPR